MESTAVKYVESLREYTVEILKRMIEVPTVVPPGENYKEFCDLASEILRDIGFDVKVVEVPKEVVRKYYPNYAEYPRYIVIARYRFGDGPTLHFNGHYDVVPAGTGWSVTEPFKPVVIDGKVYGRGATDMKGGIAAFIAAAKALVEKGKVSGTIEISLTPDEEIGGETGVGYMVREKLVKPDYALIAEPSTTSRIYVGHKGAVWLNVEVFGKSAHGSTPWFGKNAFEGMVKIAYALINEYSVKLRERVSKYEYDFPESKHPTINIGGEVKGGVKVNVVPDYYCFSIDRRVIVEEDVDAVEKELREFIEAKAREIGFEVKVTTVSKFKPCITDPSAKLVQELIAAAREAVGIEAKPIVCTGGLDMRYFVDAGIETVTYGPGIEGVAHVANEYVEIDELVKAAKVYVRLAERLLKA